MAKVELTPGIESISGTVGNLTFRTVNGKTFVHEKTEPVLPEKPTRQERAKYKRDVIIDQCVRILQGEIEDLREAMRMRPKIRSRLMSLYRRYAPEIKARTKLQRKIMTEYRAKYQPERLRSRSAMRVGSGDVPTLSRECLENDSKTARQSFC